MKRIFTLLLFIVFWGGSAMAYDFSAVCESGQTLYYNITSSTEHYTVEVTSENTDYPYYNNYPTGDLEIPGSVEYDNITYSVTSIGERAFYYCIELTSITIPNTVTSIGREAFSVCSGLTSVTIPNSIESIGNYAFKECSGLTIVNFNATNCTSMGFYNGLIFDGCTSLATVNIGENVTYIPDYAFMDCNGLTSVIIPNSVIRIGNEAFGNCSELTSITFGNSVESISNFAFYGCSGLTSVTIPNSVTSIGESAFYGCQGLTTITIPESVTSIGDYAFMNCSGLTTVNFNATNCTSMGSSDNPVFKRCNANATINIGEGVTTIPDYAFIGLIGSGTLTIPNSVTSIGQSAFQNCSELTTINFNATNCTSMGSSNFPVFIGCTSLVTLNIGESVTNIPDNAFKNCSGLTTVNFNATNCTSMGCSSFPVFIGCNANATINIGEGVTKIPDYAFKGLIGSGTLAIPNSVINIGQSAFYNCSGLTSVTIGNGVTSISESAFYNCSGLTAVYYSGNIAQWCGISFNSQPLQYAHNLYVDNNLVTNLVIQNDVPEIKHNTFYGATCLTSVTIPSSVTSIGNNAFLYCSGLTAVYYTGNIAQWCGITFGSLSSNPLSYAHNLYINNELLTNLVVPEFVTELKNYAFYGCSCLTGELSIPNSVVSIGERAFQNCIGLTSLTIPNAVTNIGNSAFGGCYGLTLINYNAIDCRFMVNAFITSISLTDAPSYSENFDSYDGAQDWGAENSSDCVVPTGWYVYTNNAIYAVPHITTNGNPHSSPNALSFCNNQEGNTSYAVLPSTSNTGIITFFARNEYANVGTLSLGYVTSSQSNVSSFVEIQEIPRIATMTFRQYEFNIPSGAYLAFRWYQSNSSYWYAAAIDDINVYYYEELTNSLTLNIGENVASIPNSAFDGLGGLTTVNFNATNCTTMGSSELPVFNTGNTLATLNIGANVTTIPNNAFKNCALIDSITCAAENPPQVFANTFEYDNLSNIPVIVPCGTIPVYENADFWYNFWRIQQSASCPVPYTITVLTSNPNYGVVTGGGEYLENTTAILTATPYEECMFVNWNDGNTDNPREITVTEDATYIATFVRGNIYPTAYAEVDTTACGSYTWNDITYTESGDYEQIFTAANTADSIVTLHLTILPLPEPEITVDGILDACNPETTSVTLSTGEYDSYMWSSGDSAESAIVTTPGSYYVEAVDSLGCHGFSEEVTIGYSTILTEAPQIKNAGMSDNGFNVIGWRVSQTEGIASFEIYREDNASDVFSLIAVVTRSSARTYIDSTANPSARAYRYKICAVDACGGMSPMSEPHKTMHLTINQGVGNDWNLIWSHYEGLDIRSYKIYRGTTKANMVVIGEVPSSQNTFTDSSNPYNIGFFYKIAIVKNTRSDDEEMLTSNIVDNGYIVTHNVIVASSNSAYGSVSGGGVYPEGTEIEIEATANAGYEFSAWNDGSTENPRRVTITSDTLFIANFMEISQVTTYNIIVYSSNPAYGTVAGGGTYEEGAEIQLTATANDGYEFVSWSDGSMDNPRTITVIEDAVYIATFAEASSVANYTITVISSNPTQGSVTGGGSYPEGSVISVEAIANDGYQFVSWSDNCTDNPRSITVVSDAMYIASFIPVTDISVTSTLEISIFPNPATDILNITSSEEISSVEIVNVMGQIVLNADVNSDNVACNVNGLTAGVYIVRIYGTNTAIICQRKFIKE